MSTSSLSILLLFLSPSLPRSMRRSENHSIQDRKALGIWRRNYLSLPLTSSLNLITLFKWSMMNPKWQAVKNKRRLCVSTHFVCEEREWESERRRRNFMIKLTWLSWWWWFWGENDFFSYFLFQRHNKVYLVYSLFNEWLEGEKNYLLVNQE